MRKGQEAIIQKLNKHYPERITPERLTELSRDDLTLRELDALGLIYVFSDVSPNFGVEFVKKHNIRIVRNLMWFITSDGDDKYYPTDEDIEGMEWLLSDEKFPCDRLLELWKCIPE